MNEVKQLEFLASDGVANLITIAESDTPNSKPLIVCIPAMGVPAQKYRRLIFGFASKGYCAASFDLRGIGHSSVRASRDLNFGYKELVEQDLPAVLDCLAKSYPNKGIVLFGHSLGGQIATLHLTQDQTNIEALILTASCSVYYKGWSFFKRWPLLFFTQLATLVAGLIGYFPGHKLGFGGREARNVMKDWARNARTGNYELEGSDVNYQALEFRSNECKSTTIEPINVLAITLADDKFAPAKATSFLLAKLGSPKVTSQLIQGADLGLSLADHFNWLKNPQAIIDTFERWFSAHSPSEK